MPGLITFRAVGRSAAHGTSFWGVGTANVRYVNTNPAPGLQRSLTHYTRLMDQAAINQSANATGRGSSQNHTILTGSWADLRSTLQREPASIYGNGALMLWPTQLANAEISEAVALTHALTVEHSARTVGLRLPRGALLAVTGGAEPQHTIHWEAQALDHMRIERVFSFFEACHTVLPFTKAHTHIHVRKHSMHSAAQDFIQRQFMPALGIIHELFGQAAVTRLRGLDAQAAVEAAQRSYDSLVASCDRFLGSPLIRAVHLGTLHVMGYPEEFAGFAHTLRDLRPRFHVALPRLEALQQGYVPWNSWAQWAGIAYPQSVLGALGTHLGHWSAQCYAQGSSAQFGYPFDDAFPLAGVHFCHDEGLSRFHQTMHTLSPIFTDLRAHTKEDSSDLNYQLDAAHLKLRWRFTGRFTQALPAAVRTIQAQLRGTRWTAHRRHNTLTLLIPRAELTQQPWELPEDVQFKGLTRVLGDAPQHP